MTSDIVITLKIGQSAGSKPKLVNMTEYGFPSTTARLLVNNEGLVNLSWHKIQSVRIRNIAGTTFPVL